MVSSVCIIIAVDASLNAFERIFGRGRQVGLNTNLSWCGFERFWTLLGLDRFWTSFLGRSGHVVQV